MTAAGAPAAPTSERVTTLELFFDLVFVFTITQLSAVLAHDLSWEGIAHVAVMLGLIWFMYGGYVWLTNAIALDEPLNRTLLLAGMCGYFILALAIPGAFDGSGLTFGIGYLLVVGVHAWLFARAGGADAAHAILRLAPSNVGSAALVLVGGAIGGTAQIVLWSVAFVAEWVVPKIVGNDDFDVAPAHFVERHGLVVIVAIGESVVAIGIGAAELAIDAELVLVAVLGLLLSAGLWWTYFGGDDERAERALAALPRRERAHAALDAFGYAHLALLLGIICLAVGLKKATGHAYDPLGTGPALTLAGGAALFLLGDVWFRAVLHIRRSAPRALGALVALATIPLGTEVAAVAQVAALVAVVAVAAMAGAPGRASARRLEARAAIS
ncbi:MAG TPA: low temperature requirement protein A [Baekduia sp.]|uniref:low temperature requirement protein A n=1 Tax=Baekduia sp. TaxID=2600305 RepID=UPI002BBAEF69|nr:low temperature requirement protein A [Baekduia sp.]HMJ32387.1 low temperature requirement protein A [Baekduia sp.]